MSFKLSEKKLYKPFSNNLENTKAFDFLKQILAKDSSFFWVSVVYGVFVSILSLAIPLSVQILIGSVTFTAILQPIIVLGIILLSLLIFSGILNALQFYVNEIFQRRFFSRMAAEIGNQILSADHDKFQQSNQTELVNRFFDVNTVQKIVPRLLTQTFTLFLQTFVGLALVTFYHPILLAFSIFVIISIYLIWSTYAKNGFTTAFFESRRKYDLVGWLDDIARNNYMFKSENGQDYARFKIDFLTEQYIRERKMHFKSLFSQVSLSLAFYAVSSSLLLIIGGWLVLKEQITIGQLVASELVLSTVLYGISQLGKNFSDFYDLAAACEKLSQFYNIPTEKTGNILIEGDELNISLKEVREEFFGQKYFFDLNFKDRKNYIISTEDPGIQKALTDLLNALRSPKSGSIEFNNSDITNINCYNLRSNIAVIDNSPFLEGTVEEYLTFNNQNIKRSQVNDALNITGFDKVMRRLDLKLDSRIIPTGWPLSEDEKILLKVSRIILLEPKLIIISEVLDMLDLNMRCKILNYLTKLNSSMVIYFSNRRDGMMDFDEYIFIDHEKSQKFSSIEELDKFEQEYFLNKKDQNEG